MFATLGSLLSSSLLAGCLFAASLIAIVVAV